MLTAILPIFFLILLGYVLKRLSIFSQGFWDEIERLTYYILFPCLLVSKMASADLSSVPISALAPALWLSLISISAICFMVKPFTKLAPHSFTSLFQGSMRFSTYIGLALAESVFGIQGLVIAVIIAALLIPMINIFVVTVLQLYGQNNQASVSQTLIAIAKNPLILGCVVGITLNISGVNLYPPISKTISLIGSTALVIGLTSVGSALILKSMDKFPSILLASFLKLLLYPIIAWQISAYFELDIITRQIMVIFCALPTASASYILAKNMGGDYQLMARIITFQTLLSLLTLMAVFHILRI
jgi:predicted permease